MSKTRTYDTEGILSLLRQSVVKGTYTIDGSLVPVNFEDVVRDLLDMQSTEKKLEFGGIDYGKLKIPCKLELKQMTLIDALRSARDVAIDVDLPAFRPPLVIRAENALDDPMLWRLWIRVPIQPAGLPWSPDSPIGGLGEIKGQQLRYKKNIVGIQRATNYTSVANRLYAYGKDGMTLDDPGYVEDIESQEQWGLIEGTYENTYATTQGELLYLATLALTAKKDPLVCYRVNSIDLSDLGFDFERLTLGSLVTVVDEDFGIDVSARVVGLEKLFDEPGNVTVDLDNRIRDFADDILEMYNRLKAAGWQATTETGRVQLEYWSEQWPVIDVPGQLFPSVFVENLPQTAAPERMIACCKIGGIENLQEERNYLSVDSFIRVGFRYAIGIPAGGWVVNPKTQNTGDSLIGGADIKDCFSGNGEYTFNFEGAVAYGTLRLHDVACGLKFWWK